MDWGSFDNTDVRDAGTRAVQLPQPRNWDSVFVVKVGTEYKWLNPANMPNWDFALRAGYIRSETPVPNDTFEPLVPDGDFNGFSVGFGMLCKGHAYFLGMIPCENSITKSIGVDLTYVNQLYESRTISNNRQDLVNGTYDTALHAGGIGVRINF